MVSPFKFPPGITNNDNTFNILLPAATLQTSYYSKKTDKIQGIQTSSRHTSSPNIRPSHANNFIVFHPLKQILAFSQLNLVQANSAEQYTTIRFTSTSGKHRPP
jgi:hypothetical protein